ncbi:MAG TPA: YkgJ family cysteine cluster protein [Kofleriaceae bacterium]
MSARDRYLELCGKVDGFFDRVKARHGDQMQCAAGCHACCLGGLTVTSVEAEEIRGALAALSVDARERAAARAAAEDRTRCAALEEDGRCAIYPARPLVCRSHGLPIRMASERGLPVVSACELNFTARGPAAADGDCILDQTTLSLTLGAIARAHADEVGGDLAERVSLADLLRGR